MPPREQPFNVPSYGGRGLEKHSSDPQHRLERRALSQQQNARRVQQYVERCYERLRLPHSKPEDAWRKDAWWQWNGVPRAAQAAREVEPRLPHVGGVLAVSDWTFAQLARANLDTPIKGALASIHLDRLAATPDAGEQRRLAKGEYHLNRPAIESEHRRQTAVEAAGYRAGKIWTPTGPTWNLTGRQDDRGHRPARRCNRLP